MRLNAYNLKHLQLLKRLQLFWDLANSLFSCKVKLASLRLLLNERYFR